MTILFRISDLTIRKAQVFAEDGDMIAFQYETGEYGWAPRKTFKTRQEVDQIIAEREARRELLRTSAVEREKAAVTQEIEKLMKQLTRLSMRLGELSEDDAIHLSREAT